MFPSLPQDVQTELEELSRRYGPPLVRSAGLELKSLFNPLSKVDRYGEVCMVVRRPGGRLLTAIKSYYPRGAYRLLTGGIRRGERVLDALLRETAEETGLQTELRRFLAAIAYQQVGSGSGPIFYTFAFLLDEVGGTLGVADPDEQLEAFREVELGELPLMAATLERLGDDYDPEINGIWSDWGRFRAVVHRIVWESLQIC